MKFFQPPFNPENIAAQYKTFAKILHPDAGGKDADFQEMEAEHKLVKKVSDARAKHIPIRGKVLKHNLRRPPNYDAKIKALEKFGEVFLKFAVEFNRIKK